MKWEGGRNRVWGVMKGGGNKDWSFGYLAFSVYFAKSKYFCYKLEEFRSKIKVSCISLHKNMKKVGS